MQGVRLFRPHALIIFQDHDKLETENGVIPIDNDMLTSEHRPVSQEDMDRIARFRLMDDDFFSETLNGKIDAVQYILNTVLERSDFTVLETSTQHTYTSATKHSIRMDIRAKDSTGRIADIEIQRADSGTGAKRARYHSSMIDRELLNRGQEFDTIAETFVIFITENDKYHAGLPLYHVDRMIRELNCQEFGDEAHIIYVNGEYADTEHPVGRLMHDFHCTRADDMLIPVLAEEVRYMKETEGGQRQMSGIMEELFRQGEAKGRAEGQKENIENMISLGYSDDIIARCLNVSAEQVAAIRSGRSA